MLLFAEGPFRARLQEEGVAVKVIPIGAAVTGVARGGGIIGHLRALPGVWRAALHVARQAGRFEVLFANSQKALVIGTIAAWIARKPLVWYLHDIVTAEHFSAANRRLCVVLGNRFADRILTNSRASAEAFAAAGGRIAKVGVVYNGFDAAAFARPSVEQLLRLRGELCLSTAPIVAVFSRLAPWKGQRVLLDALGELPEVQALFVGAPLFGDEARFEVELRDTARRRGLDGRVRFLGFREDIPELLHLADIVVHTSIAAEPFGRVIVEGMLAGKPVVAARAGGACEIIEDGVTGRLVTPGDSRELAAALRELLGDRVAAKRMGTAAFESARERFSVAQMVNGIDTAIRAVVQSKKA